MNYDAFGWSDQERSLDRHHEPVRSTLQHKPVVSTIHHQPVVSTIHHQPVASTIRHYPVASTTHSRKPVPEGVAPPDVW